MFEQDTGDEIQLLVIRVERPPIIDLQPRPIVVIPHAVERANERTPAGAKITGGTIHRVEGTTLEGNDVVPYNVITSYQSAL